MPANWSTVNHWSTGQLVNWSTSKLPEWQHVAARRDEDHLHMPANWSTVNHWSTGQLVN
jgi:hypothetical protein